jgi:hypothetical protein
VVAAVVLLFVRRPRVLDLPGWVLPAALAGMWLFELQRFHLL